MTERFIEEMKLNSKFIGNVFRSESGAIDLASIMAGVVVLGLMGGVVSATVFAVIPWAQDKAGKEQLSAVASAQSAYIGLASDNGRAISYGNADDLKTSPTILFDANAAKVKIATIGEGSNAHYIAAARSSSGKYWYITDGLSSPREANGKDGNAEEFVVRWTVLTTEPSTVNGIKFPANHLWTGAVSAF